ncbi:bifunctional diguanylate cyclase/phosphodiesterase [Pseudoroseomonas rhizosphaerae]|uniref:Bifunctional diguanylate cyclase/phosphodiesterase n=1 Tax=Teichococcus rhizosphaerae TaxID=1335062 RepID=A0A2C7AFF3_9PROT|nr:EAL domain-containing protein [Pseudoroseomonas rhizosphaerae]PHK95866.1 bifunctional diguanylate cyclase/phosphodiesterase [Pseudoroseomonas rhizosphaerae]
MMRVYWCVTEQHDLRLVLLAALVCLAGSVTALGVLRRAAQARSWSRAGWLLLSGMAGGSAIWCTHFIGILAYEPGTRLGFEPGLTLASLVIAILACTGGFAVAAGRARGAALLGGALVGGGVGAMHYTGMLAYGAGGVVTYDRLYLAASLALSVLFGMAALWRGLRGGGWRGILGGALLFSAGIVALHFTGMAAVQVLPLPLDMEGNGTHAALALTVGLVTLMVMAAAAAAHLIDHRNEEDGMLRMRRLVDSAIEGLAIVQNGRILEANQSFQAMAGLPRAALVGQEMPGALLPPLHLPEGRPEATVETQLRRADGTLLDVELVVRDNVPRPGKRVFALRDLRERREQERRIRHLALHDALTGLPNRARFTQQLEQTLRAAGLARQSVALIRLGLDRFKEINDLYGHMAGDAVLRSYARQISTLAPPGSVAARLGGDEFALLLPYVAEGELRAVLDALEALARQPHWVGPAEILASAAIGVALFPLDAQAGEALLADSDVAMRRAKALRSGGACFYQAEMDASVRVRRRLAEDLRGALAMGQLRLFYQPQVELATGRRTVHEALMRWRHPMRGFVSPAEFIPLAEESGLILTLGEWALRTACAAAAADPRMGRVAVNLSPLQFMQPGLPQAIATILAETGLPPGRLELEITESTLMQDQDRATVMVGQIRALGVQVAMDDFGTGYSSLGTLRAFSFDKIKLDRSFLREIGSSRQAMTILRAVLAIGQGLGVPVLAEGVETEEQRALLRAEGCAEAQGYLFGEPLPPEELGLRGSAAA